MIKPLPSNKVYQSFGVNAMPNNLQSNYKYTDQWFAALVATGASYFRGFYAPGLPVTETVVNLCRENHIRWGMTVARDASVSGQSIIKSIKHIGDHAADRCLWIEGINEPNYVRATGAVPPHWVADTLAKQKAIWETVKADPRLQNVKVLGPSLRDVSATEDDYLALANGGLLQWMDYAAIHRYPNGTYPDHLMDDRLALIARVWPGKPTWITETGYTNAVNSTTGQLPVPENVAGAYAPSAILEAADRGCNVTWFEMLDDPDPQKTNVESNFGLMAIRTDVAGPQWRKKPAGDTLTAFLHSLHDPGPGFNTMRVPLKITSNLTDVKSTVIQKRDGTTTVHLRRATDCYDPKAKTPIVVQKAQVTLQSASGTQTLLIDHRVTSVVL